MSAVEFSLPDQHHTDRRSPVRWVASHARRHWWVVAIAVFGAFGNAALMAVSPVLIGRAVNLVIENPQPIPGLLQITLILAASQVVRGMLQAARNFGFELTAQRVERDVRDELYASLLGKSMTFHNLQPVGDIMARATNDVREVNFLFSPGLNMVIGSLNFLILPLFIAPGYHPTLIIPVVLFMIAYTIALVGYLKKLSPITDEVRAAFGQLNTRLAEALDGIEVVKGASQENAEVDRFAANMGRFRQASIKQGDVEARFIPLLLFSITLGIGLLQALLLARAGLMKVGDVVGFFGVLLMLDFPTFTSLMAYSRISLGLAGARRILAILNREDNLDQNPSGYQQPMRGQVSFKNVSFAYNGGEKVLQEITFSVEPGKTVAVVGQTGAGKTTLMRLINRTYDTTTGSVLVDGVDVRDWNLEALRRSISIIEQDIFLFSRSIADNIAFGRPDAAREEVEAAAIAAQADEFIRAFSDGYETIIGERGVTLSGGQRQRLALARAFLTDPRILILDDSTSAIDSATEDLIQRAIFTAARGRTTFIITHRLSQIRWADLILVMRKGQLEAAGSHTELLETSEPYRRIFGKTRD